MRRSLLFLALLLTVGFKQTPPRSAIILPDHSSNATRGGFARWAATEAGQKIIRHLDPSEFQIVVAEDPDEDGAGRAPQPGIATLVAANNHAKLKSYTLILNPTYGLDRGKRVGALPGRPRPPEAVMACAWAGEIPQSDFPARGLSLPHHNRPDFQ